MDGYETYSEEDVSGDEEGEDVEMKWGFFHFDILVRILFLIRNQNQ